MKRPIRSIQHDPEDLNGQTKIVSLSRATGTSKCWLSRRGTSAIQPAQDARERNLIEPAVVAIAITALHLQSLPWLNGTRVKRRVAVSDRSWQSFALQRHSSSGWEDLARKAKEL
ncbi:hypothetical protein SCAR479_06291 [Seiridium cardinale]|uniref:Uncharacterized protein n=1 Tax=Seiridium cardinale TaxID=138064 RepID=A0ABR2XTJ0_9PEZI